MTSDGVLRALREGPLREPAHAWLYEVRNGTGYSRQERYADALVVSCWPSRGIWIAGIEFKVSRADWRRELDDPTKSAEIQRFCDHWYVAAPAGVVLPGELPERWGYYEIGAGKKPKPTLVKEAPRLDPLPLTSVFVASVLRNAAQVQEQARQRGRAEMRSELRGDGDEGELANLRKQLRDMEIAKIHAEGQERYAKLQIENLRSAVTDFERQTGASLGFGDTRRGWRAGVEVGAQFRLAEQLIATPPRELAARLKSIASELDAVAAAAEPESPAALVVDATRKRGAS